MLNHNIISECTRRRDIEIGGGLGLNISNVSSKGNGASTESLTSINFHGTAEYYFSDRWGIKVKLIYDSKGWGDGFISDDLGNTFTTDFNVNYLSIPVMANWHFGSNRNWYLNFGLHTAFLINAKDSELDMDIKESLNSTDFGLAFGIGHKFQLSDALKLYVEYDAQSGFTDVFKENSGSRVSNGRNAFNVGVLFDL